jgi:NtrC-family two-component system response regulator AlgB
MKILLIDDERNINRMMTVALEGDGHLVVAVESGSGAARQMQKQQFDLAFLDLRLGQENGLEVLAQLLQADPGLAVVIFTAFASIPTAVEAIQRGAVEYLPKPFTPDQIRQVIARIAKTRGLERRVEELESVSDAYSPGAQLTSEDPAMQNLFDLAFRTAASHASILLLGESGTGKSMLARAIHRRSLRAEHPFVTVSCPSLSRELLESDLFGHVKGAYTGAVSDTQGKVAAASGGTLYLDEIGELPLEIQPKLLRLLQEREFERVGETQTRRADVRVISSTNRDLVQAIKENKFREDLYYRLNVVALHVPPLRERQRDFARLAEANLRFFARQMGKPVTGFSSEAMQALRRYPWPGNLRELRNAIERAVILAGGPAIELEHLSDAIAASAPSAIARPEVGASVTLVELGDEHIRRVLAKTPRLEQAAAILGIDVATLYRRRRKWEAGS